MDQLLKKHSFKVEDVFRKDQTNLNIVSKIHREYCLKQNKFNPSGSSPNIFCNRLEKRMKIYYERLYKSLN